MGIYRELLGKLNVSNNIKNMSLVISVEFRNPIAFMLRNRMEMPENPLKSRDKF